MSGISERLVKLLPPAGGLFAALASAMPADAQQIGAVQAPAAWLAYAQTVSDTVQTRLGSDEPAAVRLRTYLNQLPDAGQPEGTMLKISFWIGNNGAITRIEHTPFAHQQPNDDLQTLLVGTAIGSAPPKGMLLPLRLSIRIKPQPAATPQPTSTGMTITARYRLTGGKPIRSI